MANKWWSLYAWARDSAKRVKILADKLKGDNFARKPTALSLRPRKPPRGTDPYRVAEQSTSTACRSVGPATKKGDKGGWSGSSGSSRLVGDTSLSHQSQEGRNPRFTFSL